MVRLYTNYGPITIELDHERAPKTAANFENYVRNGFYDGTIVPSRDQRLHDPGRRLRPRHAPKDGRRDPIENEAAQRPAQHEVHRGNGAHRRSALGDRRSSSSTSPTTSFSITRRRSPQGWGYCVFGKVIEGTDTVDKIKVLKHGPAWLASGRAGSQRVIERAEVI